MGRRKLSYNGGLGRSFIRGVCNWHGNCCLVVMDYPRLDLASSVERKALKGQSLLGSFFTLPSLLNQGVR